MLSLRSRAEFNAGVDVRACAVRQECGRSKISSTVSLRGRAVALAASGHVREAIELESLSCIAR